MAFNPSLPTELTIADAAQMRSQFTGLFDLIQTIPVGPAGPQGVPGVSVTGAVVDGVTTGNPGTPAAASAAFDGANVRFTFSIPRGDAGAQGSTGADGGIGPAGATGPVGPAFTSFVVESVTTLDPALPATVTAVFDGTNVRLAFGIPRGQQGIEGPQGITGATGATGPAFTSFVIDGVTTLDPFASATVSTVFDGTNVRFSFGIPRGFQGNNGNDGGPGPTGPQGAPGEVTLAQLNTAIANTSSNSNAVAGLAGPYADTDAEELRQKVNELIAALRK